MVEAKLCMQNHIGFNKFNFFMKRVNFVIYEFNLIFVMQFFYNICENWMMIKNNNNNNK